MPEATPPPPPSPSSPNPPVGSGAGHALQAPTGTRDFYPAELGRLRFIQDAWRKAAVRHGFDEIDGPTFEHAELYTIKSGEGILSELFSFRRFGGEKDFALRPEFTPTLARMYAAKANALPKPTKWFWTQSCFRAERPQRGRLREFYQWNADVLGDDSHVAEAEILALLADFFASLGLTPKDVRIKVSHRGSIQRYLEQLGVPEHRILDGFTLLDSIDKMPRDEFFRRSMDLGILHERTERWDRFARTQAPANAPFIDTGSGSAEITGITPTFIGLTELEGLHELLKGTGLLDWIDYKPALARGLAYYTGMVFEVHEASGAERAIAGGGRYDKLIELFGGPSTPAIGFGMGDVVLSLVLQDRGLFPTDEQIADRLGNRPDVFVIAAGTPEAEAAVFPTLTALRRAGLHARRSYKSTKNVGKLLKDAANSRARHAVIIEGDAKTATLKDLASGEQRPVPIAELAQAIGAR